MKKALLFALCFLFATAAYADRPIREVMQEIGIDQKLDAQIPLQLEFKDERGTPVQLGKYFGKKPVIFVLVYYKCPMLCPLTFNSLTGALRTLNLSAAKDFNVVAVSFDPKETPADALEKKNYYMKSYDRPGTEGGWSFLTGSEASIKPLVDSLGFRYATGAQPGQFAHAGGIMVLTPEGKTSRYFYGVEYAPKDLRLALVEAGQGKIGSLVDQVLLLCYHYDPMTGRYGLAIKNILRVLGALTILVVAVFIISSLRRERQLH